MGAHVATVVSTLSHNHAPWRFEPVSIFLPKAAHAIAAAVSAAIQNALICNIFGHPLFADRTYGVRVRMMRAHYRHELRSSVSFSRLGAGAAGAARHGGGPAVRAAPANGGGRCRAAQFPDQRIVLVPDQRIVLVPDQRIVLVRDQRIVLVRDQRIVLVREF